MVSSTPDFPPDGAVTVNRVMLKDCYTADDLQERVALLCENVKTCHSKAGFVGGFVALNSGDISYAAGCAGSGARTPWHAGARATSPAGPATDRR